MKRAARTSTQPADEFPAPGIHASRLVVVHGPVKARRIAVAELERAAWLDLRKSADFWHSVHCAIETVVPTAAAA